MPLIYPHGFIGGMGGPPPFASHVFQDGGYLHLPLPSKVSTTKFTFSTWVKFPASPVYTVLLDSASPYMYVEFWDEDEWWLYLDADASNGWKEYELMLSPNQWNHFVMRVDTTLSTGADRIRTYLNGNLLTPMYNENPTQNSNTGLITEWGIYVGGWDPWEEGPEQAGMKMAFTHLVVGESLHPGSFAFPDELSGEWTANAGYFFPAISEYDFYLNGIFGLGKDATDAQNNLTVNGSISLDTADLPPYAVWLPVG